MYGVAPAPGSGAAWHTPDGMSRSVAPAILDPILDLAERVNRARVGIRPIRADGILGIETTRYGGPRRSLADGVVVAPGDRIVRLHFMNERMRRVAARAWQTEAWRVGRDDLAALAEQLAGAPPAERPIALRVTTIHGPIARRAGFTVEPRPRTPRAWLDDWWMRWLMTRYGLIGRERLRHGRGPLESIDAWFGVDAFIARHRPAGSAGSAGSGREVAPPE